MRYVRNIGEGRTSRPSGGAGFVTSALIAGFKAGCESARFEDIRNGAEWKNRGTTRLFL